MMENLLAGANGTSLRYARIAFLVALVSLAIGGVAAIVVGFSRAMFLTSIDPGLYYRFLTIHGVNMLILWLPFFEVGALYAIMAIFIKKPPLGGLSTIIAYGFLIAGWFLLNWSAIYGSPPVLYTAYTPLAADPLFYIGYEFLSIGVLIASAIYIATLLKSENRGSLIPWGGGVAAIIAIATSVNGIAAFAIPLLSIYGAVGSNPLYYHWIFWGFGHDAQYINASATVLAWYLLLALGSGMAFMRYVSGAIAKLGLILILIFVTPGIGHHILVDPMYSTALKNASGNIGSHLLATGSLVSAFSVVGGVETLLRSAGYSRGLLGWIRGIPWKNPGFAGAVFSMVLFSIGGISSINLATMPTNIALHNTMWVPGHIHFIVAGGTTLAFMALSYYLVPLVFRRRLCSARLASIQIYSAFIGILIQGSSMLILGWEGAPRRTLLTPDIMDPRWWLPSTILGVGASIFVISGILFLANILLTIAGKSTGHGIPGELVIEIKENSNRDPSKKGTLTLLLTIMIASIILLTITLIKLAISPVGIG